MFLKSYLITIDKIFHYEPCNVFSIFLAGKQLNCCGSYGGENAVIGQEYRVYFALEAAYSFHSNCREKNVSIDPASVQSNFDGSNIFVSGIYQGKTHDPYDEDDELYCIDSLFTVYSDLELSDFKLEAREGSYVSIHGILAVNFMS